MRSERFPLIGSVLILLVVLSAGLVSAGPSGGAFPGAAGRAGPGPAQASGAPFLFNYQGLLLDSAGSPVADGDYQLTLTIYDVITGGTALWSETQTVAVENGLFNATLGSVTAIDPAWVDGRSLWLGITLQGEPEMEPRIALLSVPYALNANDVRNADIHPHTVLASAPGTAITGMSMNAAGLNAGVFGQTNSTTGRGVYGYAPATTGLNFGVLGQSSSTDGRGVYGRATSTTGVAVGVYGQSESSAGAGVVGQAPAGIYGVLGRSGVTAGTSYGVYGETSSTDGYGVYGTGGWGSYGVQGFNTGTGPGLGVHGLNDGYGAAVSGLNNSNGTGTWGYSMEAEGVASATGRGDNNYGVYTEDNLYSANFHSAGAIMHVVQNGDGESLERGDLVELVGLSEAPAAGMPPIIQVRKARTAHSTAILGVVDSSYSEAWLGGAPVDPTGATGSDAVVPLSGPGPIAPGAYLLIVVQGPCQVKVDAAAGPIAVGDLLVSAALTGHAAGAAGIDTAAPGTILGKALEPAQPGQRLLYVYVTLR